MKIKTLSVGPIVGFTAPDGTRIFGRGELEIADFRPRRAHAVIHFKTVKAKGYGTTLYFKMNPNFDMTGVAILEGLASETVYEYQMGYIFSEVDTDAINVNDQLEWEHLEVHRFKTAAEVATKSRSLITGSCRYSLRMFGKTWFDDRGDKTFRSILEQISGGRPIDLLLMCGDQIYADDLNFVGADDAIDEFYKRYQYVFTTKYLRQLMSSVPTYMMLDDHEIEDNWPESANGSDWVKKFPAAIHAYSTYQASHSPLFKANGGKLEGIPTHLWYTFQDGCCDFFVYDTRTERHEANPREILGPRQSAALEQWLIDDNPRVKIIVTSVPLYEHESDDKWHGYVEQRDQLLEIVRKNKVPRLVVISGDLHASMSSRLTLNNDPDFSIVSVVSSAFFWPYPHPRRRDFLLSGKINSNLPGLSFQITDASSLHPGDCFTRIDFTLDGLKVEFYDRKGVNLGGVTYAF